MFCTEACFESSLAHTDTDQVTLSGMHDTFQTVDEVMEFTLEHGLEIALHVLAGHLYYVADGLLAADFHLVEVRSDQLDLVIFYVSHRQGTNQLETVLVRIGTVKLNLHFFSTDDLTLKCRSEGYGDIHLYEFDLDVSCLQRGSVEFLRILLDNQGLRNIPDVVFLVGDYREA